MNPLTRGLRLALPLSLLVALALPAVAFAHAELVDSSPADGGTLGEPPYRLVAEYSEELGTERSRIVVRDAAGEEVARGGVSEEDAHLMVVDLSGVAPGEYTAFWTAVTPGDNGVTRGTIEFSIAEAPTPSPSPTASASPPPTSPPSPTAAATGSPSPTVMPTPSPSPSPDDNGEPTTGTGDLLVALLVAGVLLGGLLLFVWRRRAA